MEVAELHIEDSRTLAVAPDTLGPTLSAEQAAMLMACSHQWWVCRPSRCSPLKGKLNPPLEANVAGHPFHLPQQAHTLLAE